MSRIIIGADIAPTSRNEDLFIKGNIEELFGEPLISELKKADVRIFNLETPLVDDASPINKEGINLKAKVSSISGIKAINPDLLSLANNHIMDFGKDGLHSTVSILQANDIPFVGVGENLKEASKPFVIQMQEKKIGVYSCVEHEFSFASDNKPGANPYDPLNVFDHVSRLKDKCDYVIVLYHGGIELFQYTSPNLQKICRKFIDCGANIVVCQHSHCIGCGENYNDGTIIYGQGNFIFENSRNKLWNESFLIEVVDFKDIRLIPLIHFEGKIRIADDKIAEDMITEFKRRSENIFYNGFIERKMSEFSKKAVYKYLFGVSGHTNKINTYLNRITKGQYVRYRMRMKHNEKSLIRIMNYLECESQRELFLSGLYEITGRNGNE